MELKQLHLHMNGGEGENSYTQNSSIQRLVMLMSNSIIEKAVARCLHQVKPLTSMGIADLGCSTGLNSLVSISNTINTIKLQTSVMGIAMPELRVSLNDLPQNDFNQLFMMLPEFYSKIKRESSVDKCYVSCVGGSFYGRLFPTNSLHLVLSNFSLHWLSKVPPDLDANIASRHLNKGQIQISRMSPPSVIKAYFRQFQKDSFIFLRSRAEEMVSGGQMVLSFFIRTSLNLSTPLNQWEILSHALMSMASEGLVEEEKVDAFNLPFYETSMEELKTIIQKEGSFFIDHADDHQFSWDEGCDDALDYRKGIISRGQWVAKTIRAVIEPLLVCVFGREPMNEVFQRYGELLDDYFSNTKPTYNVLLISLTRC